MNRATLRQLQRLVGGPVLAIDGDIGAVRDFYFDDETWTIRFVVVDTGRWLSGRTVLLPLWALHAPDWEQVRIPVKLTRSQVKSSPDVNTQLPVSRKMEAASLAYYGYPHYWGGPALWGSVPAPGLTGAPPVGPPADPATAADDTHLRSCREVSGYHIRARDGDIGHVDDFMIDHATWSIEQLLVDTSNWIGGRWVLVPRQSVRTISWLKRVVEVSISRDAVARSPEAMHVVS
jgi:uncharacterized protein YrrD